MFDERKIRETNPKLFISKGVISPASSNRGKRSSGEPTFDMLKWLNNVLVQNGLLNADPCCDEYVQGEFGGVIINDAAITNIAETMYAAFYPTVASQALSGAGAVNVTAYLTKFTSTGAAQALTIASGTQPGQMKRVWHIVDGGSGVLTGVFVGGTTITFTTVNEFADLMWTGSSWAVLALGNFTAGGASPALA